MVIEETIERICRKYETRNPYEIANAMNIIVAYKPLGTVNGFYYECFRQKFIFLNENMCKQKELFTIAHELGHSILHQKTNTPFFKANTLFSINKLEIEANKFAANLLITDNDLEECKNYTEEQLSMIFGFPIEIIKIRLQ